MKTVVAGVATAAAGVAAVAAAKSQSTDESSEQEISGVANTHEPPLAVHLFSDLEGNRVLG